jgi:hypothetical protein
VSHLPAPQAIREFSGLDCDVIRADVLPDKRPAVLRGFVTDWPAVRHASDSTVALVRYLNRFDNGNPVDAQMTPPQVDGQHYYNETMTGINFIRNRLPLAALIEQVLRYAHFPNPPAVAAQSSLIRDCLPGFAEENRLCLVDDNVLPRIWLGNRITTPTHRRIRGDRSHSAGAARHPRDTLGAANCSVARATGEAAFALRGVQVVQRS